MMGTAHAGTSSSATVPQINKQSPEYKACLRRETRRLITRPIVRELRDFCFATAATVGFVGGLSVIPIGLAYGLGVRLFSTAPDTSAVNLFVAELVVLSTLLVIAAAAFTLLGWYFAKASEADRICEEKAKAKLAKP